VEYSGLHTCRQANTLCLPNIPLQSATFGPFDRQVVIMNTDGRTYTMLQNPQAMRLKKAGFIQDRQESLEPFKAFSVAAAVLNRETTRSVPRCLPNIGTSREQSWLNFVQTTRTSLDIAP
jgi:hypothetical protein